MPTPLVSVIMPAWNTAAYVAEAIESILAQTMGDLELLVVDDGSRDATLEIARSFADPRMQVLQNPVNLGVATARNLALAVARGQYIAMMDSDDIAMPERLAAQLDLLAGNADIDICGTDAEIFGDLAGKATDVAQHDPEIKAMLIVARAYIVNPTVVVRRALIERHALRFRSDLVVTSDYAFWVACMRAGARFANIKRRLLRYRWHGKNISGQMRLLQSGVDVSRQAVIGMFFPMLRVREVEALASLFGTATYSFDQLCASVAAAEIAVGDKESRFGENRQLIARLIARRIRTAQRSVAKRSAKADAATT